MRDRFTHSRWAGTEPVRGRNATPQSIQRGKQERVALLNHRKALAAKLHAGDQVDVFGMIGTVDRSHATRISDGKVPVRCGKKPSDLYAPDMMSKRVGDKWVKLTDL